MCGAQEGCQDPRNCPLRRVYDAAGSLVGCGALGSQAPYICEHRWPAVAAMAAWRGVAGPSGFTDGGYYFLSNGQQAVLTRGSGSQGRAFLAVNVGGSFSSSVGTRGMPAGTYCNVAIDGCWPCTRQCSWTVQVTGDGHAQIQVALARAQLPYPHVEGGGGGLLVY